MEIPNRQLNIPVWSIEENSGLKIKADKEGIYCTEMVIEAMCLSEIA